jgi:hypothetical protein
MCLSYRNVSSWTWWRNVLWFLSLVRTNHKVFQHHQFNSPVANQIKSHHKRSRWPNRNKVMHFYHISLNNEERPKCWRCDGLSKKKGALIHFNSPFPSLILTNHVPILKFMGTCGHHFTLHLELWQGQWQIANVRKNYSFGKG